MMEFKKQRNLLTIVAILLVLSAGMYGLRDSAAATVHMASAPPDFKLPFWGYCIIYRGPNTGTHDGRSAEAIDFAPSTPSTWAKGKWNVAVATYPGTVIYSGWDNAGCPNNYSFGNLVVIDHHNGMYSYYAHLDKLWRSVGDYVLRGWPVGEIGGTGCSPPEEGPMGEHLHFEVREGVNASNIHSGSPVRISGMERIEWHSGDSWAENLVADFAHNDGEVNCLDFSVFVQHYGDRPYDSDADIDLNGEVNILDFSMFVGNYGRESRDSWLGAAASPVATSLSFASSANAVLELTPSGGTFLVGETIEVQVILDTDTAYTDGGDILVSYNPDVLEVQDADPETPGIQVSSEDIYGLTVANSVDTREGRIDLSTGSMTEPFRGRAVIASIQFSPLAPASSTGVQVEFTLGSTLDSNVVESETGAEILSGVVNASFTIGEQDVFEMDDVASNAKAITVDGTGQRHNFHSAGDTDWISFGGIGGTTYYLLTSNLGPTSDTYLSLYDVDATSVIATNNDFIPGLARFSYLEWTAPANGTYYAKVQHSDGSVYGPGTHYGLTISTTKPDWANLKIAAISYQGAAPLPGAPLSLRVDYLNTGPITTTNTVITATIPVGTGYASSDIDGEAITSTIDGYDLTFDLQPLGPRTGGYHSLNILLEVEDDVPIGRLLIAEARLSSDKTDPDLSDNNALAVTCVTILGDLDCNCIVDIADIMEVASRWRCKCDDVCYDPFCDMDGDCDIDVVDIMKVVAHWGESCADCIPDWSLDCSDSDSWNNSNMGSTDRIDTYSCVDWDESGPEYAYTFTPAASGQVAVSLNNLSADLDLFILAPGCNATDCLAHDDFVASFDAAAGQTYYIVVDGYQGAISDYTISVDCLDGGCVPDWTLDCGGGDWWNNGGPGSTDSIGSYSCINWDESGPEYAYAFVPSVSGQVDVSLSDLSADLDLFILAPGCNASNCLAYGDATASFDAVAGHLYDIVVDGYEGAVGDYTINVSCPATAQNQGDRGQGKSPWRFNFVPTIVPGVATPHPTANPLKH